jgi:hypothetical protein
MIDTHTAAGIILMVLAVGSMLAWFLSNGDKNDE